jgi:hypothetical protein
MHYALTSGQPLTLERSLFTQLRTPARKPNQANIHKQMRDDMIAISNSYCLSSSAFVDKVNLFLYNFYS